MWSVISNVQRIARAATLAAVALTAAACAHSGAATLPAAAHSYSGPLHIPAGAGRHPQAGAAGNVVDCRTWSGGATAGPGLYHDGATADDPDAALREEGIFDGYRTGLAVAKRERDRVLYVLENREVVKEAVIVHNGPATKGAGGAGWYVESWATCDAAEFPRQMTEAQGVQLWSDRSGRPVATTTIVSSRGAEHCGWQSMTFLELRGAVYVRDPLPELREYFAVPYRAHVPVPREAIDTGFRRNGARLWLSADRTVAYVGAVADAEAWPRTVKPLACG
ncbi:MAG TPA: hypothetical protein VHC23_00160 [Jatrophihabitans sp.]|nr:hypothetical protein [Jatrophihabitans sp.]